MNIVNQNPNDPYSLLRMGEAWRNRPGLVTLLMTFLLCVVVLALAGASAKASFALALLFGLLAFAVYLMGMSAAGIQFMDQAAGRPVGPTLGALMSSPMVVLRSLGLLVILLLCWLVFYAVEALVLFLCRMPGLGPLLYAVAFPVLVLANSLVLLGMSVATMLSFPALCEGHSLKTSLAQLWAIVVQRPVEAFLKLLILSIALAVVVSLFSAFIGVGFMSTGLASAAILGPQMRNDMGGIMGMVMGGEFGESQGAGGLVTAGLFGGAIVFAIVGALFTAMGLLGLSLTYLKVTGGIDTTAAAAAMEDAIAKTKAKALQAADEAKRRANEAQAAARQRMEQASANEAARSQTHAPAALACPACKATVSPDELFCGNCGHKLQ
jgi:hypothetical protein